MKIHHGWWIVVACCAITCCTGIVGTCGGNFYRPVAEELGVGIGKLTIYMTVMSLTMAALFPVAGKLLSKNLNMILLLGGVLQYVAFGLMSCFTNVYQFYVAGLFIGIGASITMFMAVPILINMWFVEKKGLAMGIALSFSGVSGAIASMIVGYTIPAFGWRMSYIIIACIGLAIFVPSILFLVKTPEQKNTKPYGYEKNIKIQNDATILTKTDKTLSPSAQKSALFCMMICAAVLSLASVESTQVSAFSTGHFNLSIGTAATMLSCFSIGLVIGKLIFGALDDKFGHIVSFLFGIALIVVSQIMLLISNDSILAITFAVIVAGFSFAVYSVLPPLMTSAIFGEKDYNKFWAYIMSAGCIVSAFGAPLYGAIFDNTNSYTLVFIIIAILAAIGGITGTIAIKIGQKTN